MKYAIVLPLLVLFSCGEKQETIQPIESAITESVYASGSIESKNQYTAFATASGIVSAVYFSDGDAVQNGSPLLSISSVAQQLNKDNAALVAAFQDINTNQGKLREAKQSIELARAKMVNDSIQYDRQKKLNARGVGTQVEFEAMELSYKNAKLSYSSSKENYNDLNRQLKLNSQQAKNNLKIVSNSQQDYTVKSMVDGELFSLNVAVGEIISPQTPIAILGEKNSFVLKMQVDEYDIDQIKIGQKVMVVLDTDRKKSYEAKISKIYPLMNMQSKTFLVEALFVTRPEKVYPNVSFEANVVVKTKTKALLIPREYLIDEDKVLNQKGDTLKVKTGLMDYNYVEILSGLSKNQKIQKPE